MKEMKMNGKVLTDRKFHKKNIPLWFCMGLVSVLVMAVPYMILGTDSIVTYHDQLDGEMIAYILQAKHLFSGDILPEFLGGASKTALTLPAPLSVLFFLPGNYFAAYVILQLMGSITGYVGMYLLAGRTGCHKAAAMAVGVMFAYLPFLPVYGLSQYGIPLLIWFILQMREGHFHRIGMLYALVYALNSSLVLVGFAILGILFLYLIWNIIRKAGQKIRRAAITWAGMLIAYIASNFGLLVQLLTGSGEISHKQEYVLGADSFFGTLKTAYLEGGQHSVDYHIYILAAAVIILILGAAPAKNIEWVRRIGSLLGLNFLFALTAALWNAEPGIWLRSNLSLFGSFQLDRVLWVAPAFWYLLLACLWACIGGLRKEGKQKSYLAGLIMLTCVTGATGITILKESNLKPNVQKLVNGDYKAISYSDYYALGIMEQVEIWLEEATGFKQEEYRVVSLGIDPAAALYAGFYCLDGYSNHYSLAYKHEFRRIIAPELEKSSYLADYYDGWGNRCYILSAETPGYYTIQKGGFFFADLDLDTHSLKSMGGKYLFSAAYIQNAQESGLRLMREEPFETEGSYYRIFLYEVEN